MTNDSLRKRFSNELKQALPPSLQEEVKKALAKRDSSAKLALNLCNIFMTNLNAIIIESKNNQRLDDKNGSAEKMLNQRKKEVYVFGAQFLYTLREFLTGEEIIFHIGIKNSKGSYKDDIYVSQREVVKNFSAISGKDAVGLLKSVETKLKTLDNVKNKDGFISQWKTIESLAQVSINNLTENKEIFTNSSDKEVIAYQKAEKDTSVYGIKTTNKNNTDKEHIASKYYRFPNNDMRGFNDGWLWEWYDSLIHGADQSDNEKKITKIHNSLAQGILLPLFETHDSTPGLRQGDYVNFNNRQVQNKYDNEKIISYVSIYESIEGLKKYLEGYIANANANETSQDLVNYVKKTFFPKTIDQVSDTIAQDILDKFNSIGVLRP